MEAHGLVLSMCSILAEIRSNIRSVQLPGLCSTPPTNDILNPPLTWQRNASKIWCHWCSLWFVMSFETLSVCGWISYLCLISESRVTCKRKRPVMKGWGEAHVDVGSLVRWVTLSIKASCDLLKDQTVSGGQDGRQLEPITALMKTTLLEPSFLLTCLHWFIYSLVYYRSRRGGRVICLG